jgi:hypothetical protein
MLKDTMDTLLYKLLHECYVDMLYSSPMFFQAQGSPDNGPFRSAGWYTVMHVSGSDTDGT